MEVLQDKSRELTAVIGCAAENRSSHWRSTKRKGLISALLLAIAALQPMLFLIDQPSTTPSFYKFYNFSLRSTVHSLKSTFNRCKKYLKSQWEYGSVNTLPHQIWQQRRYAWWATLLSSLYYLTRESLVNYVPQQLSNWFCCPYVRFKVATIFSLPGSQSQTKWPPFPYLPSHLSPWWRSPNRFPLAHMAKQNGRHFPTYPHTWAPGGWAPWLTWPNKMAAISLLTLKLEPLGMSPPAHMAKQNGHHLPTYPHTWAPGDEPPGSHG